MLRWAHWRAWMLRTLGGSVFGKSRGMAGPVWGGGRRRRWAGLPPFPVLPLMVVEPRRVAAAVLAANAPRANGGPSSTWPGGQASCGAGWWPSTAWLNAWAAGRRIGRSTWRRSSGSPRLRRAGRSAKRAKALAPDRGGPLPHIAGIIEAPRGAAGHCDGSQCTTRVIQRHTLWDLTQGRALRQCLRQGVAMLLRFA